MCFLNHICPSLWISQLVETLRCRKMRGFLYQKTVASKVLHWWIRQYCIDLNLTLQDVVDLLCCNWCGPLGSCGQLFLQLSRSMPAEEGRRTWGVQLPYIKTLMYVWEGSCSSTEQCVQQNSAKEEDSDTGEKQTPGLCRSSPTILLCPRGILDTACSEQRMLLPLLEKVLWPCVKHQSKGAYGSCVWGPVGWHLTSPYALYNYFFFVKTLSRSLKTYNLVLGKCSMKTYNPAIS